MNVLIENLVVGSFAANCYVLQCESTKKGIVIDPGDESERILSKIKQMDMTVEKIVLTHGHPDHCAGVKGVKAVTDASVMMHAGDIKIVNDHLLRGMLGINDNYVIKVDELLEHDQKIEVGSITLSVISTPGHSPGSICLKGDGVIFTGDLLFAGGIGRSDLPGGSTEEIARSLRMIMRLDPDIKVYPGHGPVTTIGAESRGNIYLC